ncbi:radical SAM protein [Sandaracinobacter sp. RS1-74]|uniref:radical SAM protein n=1 Tax=Sandaracinobacteroides sayramensis TaxID=2913411 RepID=UPI001EDBCF36|nr:radical SAM protein [Sandaracinobacteroides sayramensis]MCG2842466.1 radical SAM protein [Sandaracinobacteroides sayramensis]
MWPYHPELLERAVPRYTSYPTAAEFRDEVGAPQQVQALHALASGTPVSLYAHIPFCKEICWYCGCNTNRSNRVERVQSYLEALEAEIDWLARQVAGKVRLGRLSLGGGSPNALDPLGFVRLIGQILTLFGSEGPEISVELDPRTLDREWAGLLGKVRASRASLGVQTLEPHVMQRIGRVQPRAMIADSVAMLRDSGVTSLNFDLMYGLPGQSMDDLLRTLDSALELAPDRIALFGYAHVPALIPRQRRIDASDLPDVELRFWQAARGHQRLLAAGLEPVGFDHFAQAADPLAAAAREGRLRRNFQGFTDDPAEALLGVGATAITSLPERIVQNEKNPGRYRMRVLGGQPAGTLGVERSADDRERALVIEDLLCGRAADLSGLPGDRLSELRLTPFLEAGLCRLEDDRLQILPDGLPYSRAIAACFDRHRAATAGRFSSAV